MPLRVAIVGSGPSGFYAAEALLRQGDVAIDLIERLPTPFGLVRGGVAPDHQSTKQVVRAFERTAQDKAVAYFGNVEIGRDLSMDELRDLYDAVVLAIGAPADRPLGIPGEDLPGVVGSAAFVGWYNGHPDFADVDPPLDGARAVVIGNGNVALDIARVLVKTPQEMAASDIAAEAGAAIATSPLTEVVLLGRRGPVEARFTFKELREMGALAAASTLVEAGQLPAAVPDGLPERERRLAERNLAILRGFPTEADPEKPKRVRLEFFGRPVAVLGARRVEGLRWERTALKEGRLVGTGEFHELACNLVVPAIGYRSLRIPGVPFDAARGRLRNREGRIARGLYCVGWCRRGPSGVIGSNKQDGDQAAESIAREVRPGAAAAGRPGREGLRRLLAERRARWIDYPAWQAIDAAERAAAHEGAPRRKFVSIADMLALLDAAPGASGS